jgi:hypothetical protein
MNAATCSVRCVRGVDAGYMPAQASEATFQGKPPAHWITSAGYS